MPVRNVLTGVPHGSARTHAAGPRLRTANPTAGPRPGKRALKDTLERARHDRRLRVARSVNVYHERVRQLPVHRREFPVNQQFPYPPPSPRLCYLPSPGRAQVCERIHQTTQAAIAAAISVGLPPVAIARAARKAPGRPTTSTRRKCLQADNMAAVRSFQDVTSSLDVEAKMSLLPLHEIITDNEESAAALALHHHAILVQRDIERTKRAAQLLQQQDPAFQVVEGERMGLIPSECYLGLHALVAADNARRIVHSKKVEAIEEARRQGTQNKRKSTSALVYSLPEAQRKAQAAGAGGGGGGEAGGVRTRKEMGLAWSSHQLQGFLSVGGERVACTDALCPFSATGSHSGVCRGC